MKVPIISTKVGFDRVIEKMRTAFEAELLYLETYPAVKKGSAKHLNGDYPEVYANNGSFESIRVMPDNSKKAILFFEKNRQENEMQTGLNSYDMSLIFWFNLYAIDNTKTYDYTSEIIEKIVKILRGFPLIAPITIINNYKFENYSFVDVEGKQMLTYPYNALKINLRVRDC